MATNKRVYHFEVKPPDSLEECLISTIVMALADTKEYIANYAYYREVKTNLDIIQGCVNSLKEINELYRPEKGCDKHGKKA